MRRPQTKYNFKIKFVCPKCSATARLVQFTRHWNFVESFNSEEGLTELKEHYKPEITNFRCGECGETAVNEEGKPVEGRRRMYNWLFDHNMLRTDSGGTVNSKPYKFDDADLEKRELEQGVPDEECNPLLLP